MNETQELEMYRLKAKKRSEYSIKYYKEHKTEKTQYYLDHKIEIQRKLKDKYSEKKLAKLLTKIDRTFKEDFWIQTYQESKLTQNNQ